MYPDFSKLCSVAYALPVDSERSDIHLLIDIKIGEGFKFQDVFHYVRLLIYLIRNRKHLDFVHFYATVPILFGPWLARLARLPCLITVTGFGRVFSSSEVKYQRLRFLYRTLFSLSVRLSRGVFFQNYTDLETVSNWLPQSREKLFYVGSGVDIPVCQEKDFYVPRLKVLLVARLLPDKGIDDFIEAAERLQGHELEFVLVGPPSVGFAKLEQRVKYAASRGVITYLGELDAEATQRLFRESHIFFFPSYYGEGMPRVMLEAGFACACPVAYNIPPNQDLITEGRGFLVPVGDKEQIIELISRLRHDRSLLANNAHTYQTFIIENYDMGTFAHRQDQILTELFVK